MLPNVFTHCSIIKAIVTIQGCIIIVHHTISVVVESKCPFFLTFSFLVPSI